MQQVKVTFQPLGRTVHVLAGTTLLEAAARAGLTIDTPCGGQGTCGKCRVQVRGHLAAPGEADRCFFSAAEIDTGWRLACQTPATDGAVVTVPQASLFADQHQILTTSAASAGELLPAVRKIYVELAPPTSADPAGDLNRLERVLGDGIVVDASVLRELGAALRAADWRGTAVLADGMLIGFESGDTTSRCFGAAFDVGTTTLVGALLDLTNGNQVAVASCVNPQVSFGDDVVSRIHRASASGAKFAEMQQAVAGAIDGLLSRLCNEAAVRRDEVYEIAFAGNTTMQQLLCGIDVSSLGHVPFTPATLSSLTPPAAELGLAVHPHGLAYVMPVIGGFVGGDTVAGLLATRLADDGGPSLMVDIGTNGEIVLCVEGRLTAASTAAGPALEGARISCGMRAAQGAIEKVVFGDGDVQISVIGDVEPVGICGSGLIDLIAELLRAGVVTSDGRMLSGDELPASVGDAIRARASLDEHQQPQFLISGGASPLWLRQRDVRELQLAAGAIRAGISILLRQAGRRPEDLKRVYLAGGFGSYIRRDNAQRIGLLPGSVHHESIHYVGNASLAGARWALLSTGARAAAEQLARKVAHVDLSRDGQFQMEFAEAMIFPD